MINSIIAPFYLENLWLTFELGDQRVQSTPIN